MKSRLSTLLILLGLLSSCADIQVKPSTQYGLSERNYLYDKEKWKVAGRLAYSDKSNSLAASINWEHLREKDKIVLAGPLGVGGAVIGINGGQIEVDYNGKRIQVNGSDEDLIAKHIGVSVPIVSLKYWIIGLADPDKVFVVVDDGFIQLGWRIQYQQMEVVEGHELPKKIKVEKGRSKLKLVIDRWEM